MLLNRRQLMKSTAIAAVAIPASAGTLMLTGCDSSWINTAIADLPTAIGIAQSILGIVVVASGNGAMEPAAAVAITAAGTLVQTGLVTLQSLITDYKNSPNGTTLDKIDAALTDLQKNLSAILQVGGIKDPNLQVAIATATGLAIAVVSAIQTLVPPAPVSSAVRRAAQTKMIKPTVIPNKEQVSSMFNAVMVLNGYAQFQVK